MTSSRELLSSRIIHAAMKEFGHSCRSDWDQIGAAHILLTGGTGFFGSWIIASFAALRHAGLPIEMTVLSRNPEAFIEANPSLKLLSGLSFKKGDVSTATIPFSITHVFHFATATQNRTQANLGDESAEIEMRQTIVEGTRRMLSEAERVGAKRFLLASSGAVYAKGKTDRPLENQFDLLSPFKSEPGLTVYGAAKREAERLCFEAAKARRVETVTARGFAFSGPLFPLDGPYAISNFMSSMLNDVALQVKSPETVRSFLDGRDLVRALWRILARGNSGEAYNVGSDESVSMRELADLIRSVAVKVGRKVPEVRVGPPLMQGADIYRPSIEKLKWSLGWSPEIGLRESLKAHADWVLEHRPA